MSRIIAACDAIVAAINDSAVLPMGAATARRGWLPEYTLEELETLRTDCLPIRRARELLDRSTDQVTTDIVICVQKHVGTKANDAACLALLDVVEAIEALLNRSEVNGFRWDASQIDPIYDPDAMQTQGVFKTFLRLTHSIDDQPLPD